MYPMYPKGIEKRKEFLQRKDPWKNNVDRSFFQYRPTGPLSYLVNAIASIAEYNNLSLEGSSAFIRSFVGSNVCGIHCKLMFPPGYNDYAIVVVNLKAKQRTFDLKVIEHDHDVHEKTLNLIQPHRLLSIMRIYCDRNIDEKEEEGRKEDEGRKEEDDRKEEEEDRRENESSNEKDSEENNYFGGEE